MNSKRLAIALVALIAIVLVMAVVVNCSLRQSDATIERIDRKIEMYERSR